MMERWNSLPLIVRQIVLGVGIFALGAAFSIGYSYRPLHGALTFKVDSLEARLDERNREYLRLKDELTKLENDESTRIDPETLSQVESELAKTKQALRDVEKKAKRAESKRADANANADRWRKRFESLRDQQQVMPASVEPRPVAAPTLETSPTRNELSTAPAPSPDVPSMPGSTNGEGTPIPVEREEGGLPGSDAFPRP